MPPTKPPTLSPADVRRLDLNAEELGVSVERLMGNAGKALAKAVARQLPKGGTALFLCGKGNNGGDGFAAAAELQAQGRHAIVLLADPASQIRSPAARKHFARLDPKSVRRWTGKPPAAHLVVDCLLGAGQEGEPRGAYAAMVRWMNRQRKPVVACDVPTGLGTKLAVRPKITVTFHAPKDGMTQSNSGKIEVAAIGIPLAAERDIGLGDLVAGYHVPHWDSHKGDNGVVLVVAGSIPLAGAPHYNALGAYRTGADLVHCAVPADVASVLRAWDPHPIVHAVCSGGHLTEKAVKPIADLMDRCTALLIGPGLGQGKDTRKAARAILEEAAKRNLPTVVDADGLDALDDDLLRRHGHRMVLTPHAREFLDLSGKDATRANVQAYAAQHDVVVVRKSAVDVVSDGERTRECHRGHPTLTVGGTGDVLAGVAAELLAKGTALFEAACAASYLTKCAGEVAAGLRSYGATASDVAEALPAVLLRLP